MKKLLVRSVFVLGLVSGFGVGMAQSPAQPASAGGEMFCDDYACNVKCKRAGYVEGWCNGDLDCYCSEF